MTPPNVSTEEEDVFEFLNSLPEDKDGSSTNVIGQQGKSEEDILDFLDELEASDTKITTKIATFPNKPPKAQPPLLSQDEETTPSEGSTTACEPSQQSQQFQKRNQELNDPITSLTGWWSSKGSTRVSSQISSLWGTAQSISEQAQKQAENAIKLAKEQGIENNLKKTFKDIGITGVLEGDRELTDEEKSKLLILPDTKNAIDSINKGFNLFSNQLTNVIEKIQNDINIDSDVKDEVLDIGLVHDLKNYKNLSKSVKKNFETVMRTQVDGDIQVNITETGILSSDLNNSTDSTKNLGLFLGKLSDGEKLIRANIESVIKSQPTEEPETKADIMKSNIYIGLLATSVNLQSGDESIAEDSEMITIDEYESGSFSFTAILIDKTHNLTIVNRSQPFPLRWCRWLDGKFVDGEANEEIDPSEWVVDWVNKGLDMTFGVLAQTYVIKRMGY